MTDTRVADPSLELARDLRRAESARADSLRQVLAEYDVASSVEARWEAAAALLLAIEKVDGAYAERKRAAVETFERRQREVGLA